jgi:hypothetical protein
MTRKRSKTKHLPVSDPLLHIPDEELDIYITSSLTTPPDMDRQVSQFCKKLSPKANPVFLIVQPPDWSRLNYCNKNVERIIELHGGSIVLGYKIWYVPSLYIEAERHAVWLSPKGELMDITFNKDGETKILFLPVPKLTTVSVKAETKPREGFHPRVMKFIEFQIWTEKMKSQFSRIDDTWEGWERATSFESWIQSQQRKANQTASQ